MHLGWVFDSFFCLLLPTRRKIFKYTAQSTLTDPVGNSYHSVFHLLSSYPVVTANSTLRWPAGFLLQNKLPLALRPPIANASPTQLTRYFLDDYMPEDLQQDVQQ